MLDRGRHAVAYAKGVETIADVLVAAGASDAVLVLEEQRGARRDPRATRTGSRTPTTPTSSARAAPRTRSSRRCGALDARRRCSTTCARARKSLPAPTSDRRRLAELARQMPAAARRKPRRTGGCGASSELAETDFRLDKSSSRRPREPSSYSTRRVRARPASDSDPVRRHGLGRGARTGRSSSELPLRPAVRVLGGRTVFVCGIARDAD